jgi:hypothetical protein
LIASQLELVRGRLNELTKLEQELTERQQRITGKLEELA